MQTAKTSSRQEYNSLKSLLRETNESSEKLIMLSSLLSCPDPGIVSEVLEYIIHSENKAMIPGLSVSWGAREAAWTWLKHNWDFLLKTFQSKIGTFVSKTVKLYASVEKANEIKEFFANRTIPSIVKSINQSIDQIYVNVKWAESIQHDRRKLVKVFRSCHSTSVKPLGVSPE
uniref:ERAP1-like C-terminal domain-containing protein n=1 Tax=Kalanchoe fedtschenkoi TaxID=63787 RepID=A0A7N0VCJ3_KALFE